MEASGLEDILLLLAAITISMVLSPLLIRHNR